MYTGEIPSNLKYTKEHEWAKAEHDTAIIGITDYAQHALTDVVFVELPEVGKKVHQFKPLCVIESVKSVSDVFAPFSGEVVEVNNELSSNPEFVNQSPYEKGWIAKIKIHDKKEEQNLMDNHHYVKHLEHAGH